MKREDLFNCCSFKRLTVGVLKGCIPYEKVEDPVLPIDVLYAIFNMLEDVFLVHFNVRIVRKNFWGF